jgi:malate dehydrogenase
MKITVVGAGNVGATVASVVAEKNICRNIILLDVVKGVAEGKALDMIQASAMSLHETRLFGVTDNYSVTADSNVVVITSGFPRSPGMSREDLVLKNAKIVKTVTENVIAYSPDAFIIVVSNPLDAMAYVAYKTAKVASNKVIGMAGMLDKARYIAFLAAEIDCSPKDIQAVILGGHGDDMVPLKNYTTVCGIPVSQFIDDDKLDAIINRTRVGGGEIVSLLGKSAWYAPGYAAALMVEAILLGKNRIMPVSAYLQGEYGLKDMFFGVPVKIGKNGIEQVLEIKLTDEEKILLKKSATSVQGTIDIIKNNNIL